MLAALLAAVIAAAPSAASVTGIEPIHLHPGVNIVAGFTPNGRSATIVQGWRGNGNAHGYNVWLVLTPKAEDQPYGVVDLDADPNGDSQDLIRDDPFDGERTLGVILFARARVNGRPASILVDARLDESSSGVLADHATATITVFRLVQSADVLGTPDVFEPILVTKTTARYCNADAALHAVLAVPLPPGYAGANPVDGCS